MGHVKITADVDDELLTRVIDLLRKRPDTPASDANAVATLIYAAAVVCAELEDRKLLVVDRHTFAKLARASFAAAAQAPRPDKKAK